jgi:hypothetical protein
MSKTALGRSLGKLLDGTRIPSQPTDPEQPGASPTSPVGPGLGTLLQGQKGGEADDPQLPLEAVEPAPASPVTSSAPVDPDRFWLWRVTLIAGDVILLTLAARVILRSPGPTWFDWILAALATAVGGWMAYLAVPSDIARKESEAAPSRGAAVQNWVTK